MTASARDSAEGEAKPTRAQRAAALGARLDELLATGDSAGACERVAVSFAERSDAGDLPEVAALISALPDTVLAASPRVLIELARACDAEARAVAHPAARAGRAVADTARLRGGAGRRTHRRPSARHPGRRGRGARAGTRAHARRVARFGVRP